MHDFQMLRKSIWKCIIGRWTPEEFRQKSADVILNAIESGSPLPSIDTQFLEKGKVFMVAEAFCHYLVEPGCWSELSDARSKDVVLPKAFINSLAGISVSTVRGVLCAKTENTPFSKYFVPLFMVDLNQGEDLKFTKPE